MSKNQRINQVEPLVTKKDAKSVYDYLTSGGWVTEHNVTREFEKQVKDAFEAQPHPALAEQMVGEREISP